MISIKDKYNIGVFSIRAPGVHVHAWGLNISPFLFLCVCRRVHAPLSHYWTCMHSLCCSMMKIHHIYENISSEMYIYGRHRNLEKSMTSWGARLSFVVSSQFWRSIRSVMWLHHIKVLLFLGENPFSSRRAWHSLLILRRPSPGSLVSSRRSETTLTCLSEWLCDLRRVRGRYASVLHVEFYTQS